jgi:hypothetical protein
MTKIWGWLVAWWRGSTTSPQEVQQARKRLDDVVRDDIRVERLDARMKRVQRENHLGPSISRALRARRP